MLIHIGLYVQHLLVVKHYIQPTSRQVRVLSAVVYMAYAAGYFVASTLQDGPGTFPNYACTISEILGIHISPKTAFEKYRTGPQI